MAARQLPMLAARTAHRQHTRPGKERHGPLQSSNAKARLQLRPRSHALAAASRVASHGCKPRNRSAARKAKAKGQCVSDPQALMAVLWAMRFALMPLARISAMTCN